MTNEKRINKLTEYINKSGEWFADYQDHEDNIGCYAELFDGSNLFYGEIDQEYEEHVKSVLETLDASSIYNLCDDPYLHHGINCVSNEIWSATLGEVEHQLDSEEYGRLIKDMSEDEISTAKNNADYFVNNDCIYLDMNHDRVSLCLNIDLFLKEYPMEKNMTVIEICKKNKIELSEQLVEFFTSYERNGEEVDLSDLYNHFEYDGRCHEFVDGKIDIYTHDLMKWNAENYSYVDDAIGEGLVNTDKFDMVSAIQAGQFMYYNELFINDLSDLQDKLEEVQNV